VRSHYNGFDILCFVLVTIILVLGIPLLFTDIPYWTSGGFYWYISGMLYDFGCVYQYGLYFTFSCLYAFCCAFQYDTVGTVYSIQLSCLSYSLLSGLREHIQESTLQIGNPDAVTKYCKCHDVVNRVLYVRYNCTQESYERKHTEHHRLKSRFEPCCHGPSIGGGGGCCQKLDAAFARRFPPPRGNIGGLRCTRTPGCTSTAR